MYTYNNRPTEKFCTKNSYEIYEIVKDFCHKHKIETIGFVNNLEYHYLCWNPSTNIVSGHGVQWGAELSTPDFLAKFRTVEESSETKRERLVNELIEQAYKLSHLHVLASEIKKLK